VRLPACTVLAALLAAASAAPTSAQDLEPRAYSAAPVGANFLGALQLHSTGGVALDADLPLKNPSVAIESSALYYSRVFDLFGRQASIGALLPYAWADASADIAGGQRAAQRSGPGDPRFRFAANLLGGPARSPKDFAERTPAPFLGTSLTVIAPFGQYSSDRLFNIGSNRWAAKPELGLSYPLKQWSIEGSAGAWLFADNDHFFGHTRREQDPITTLQGHVVYNFAPSLWLSADATYYTGGRSTVGGIHNDDRQEAIRIGLTLSVPIVDRISLKLAWSETVDTRLPGSGFATYIAAFQFTFFDP
jgi:hypothetical protein